MPRNQSSNEKAITKYNASISVHNMECEVQWSRFGSMLIVNSIFITLVSLSYGQDGQNLPQFTKIVFQFLIPILGLVICYWWFKVTEKGFFWIDFWISQANALEASISSSVNPVKKGAEYSRINEPKLTRKSTRWIVGIISLIYIGILIGNLLEVNRVFLR